MEHWKGIWIRWSSPTSNFFQGRRGIKKTWKIIEILSDKNYQKVCFARLFVGVTFGCEGVGLRNSIPLLWTLKEIIALWNGLRHEWPFTWQSRLRMKKFYFKLREVINGQPQSSFSEHIYYIPRFQFFENDSHLAEIVQKNRSARILTRGQSVRHFTIFTHCLSLISNADWHDQVPSRFYYNNLKRWEKRLRVHKGLIYGEKNLSFEIFFSLNIER